MYTTADENLQISRLMQRKYINIQDLQQSLLYFSCLVYFSWGMSHHENSCQLFRAEMFFSLQAAKFLLQKVQTGTPIQRCKTVSCYFLTHMSIIPRTYNTCKALLCTNGLSPFLFLFCCCCCCFHLFHHCIFFVFVL